MKMNKPVLALLIFCSIFTLGIFNLLMYLVDGITPKEFFSPETNPFLECSPKHKEKSK